jgi:hypothetical protein
MLQRCQLTFLKPAAKPTRVVVATILPAGAFLSQLPRLAPGLTSLDLSGCGGLSGQDLSNLLAQMQQLERLALDGIDEVRLCAEHSVAQHAAQHGTAQRRAGLGPGAKLHISVGSQSRRLLSGS